MAVVGDIADVAQLANHLQHPLTRSAKTALQHIAYHQRTCVDKGVSRLALLNFELQQRIKRVARGIFTYALPNLLLLIVIHRHHQAQYLRDRLNREALVGVTGLKVAAIDGTHRNRQLVRLDRCQRWNVVGYLPLAD